MRKIARSWVAAAIVLLLVVVAMVINIGRSIDWRLPAAHTAVGMRALSVAYWDFFRLNKSSKPSPYVIEIRADNRAVRVAFVARQLHLGGSVEYLIDRTTNRIVKVTRDE